MKIISFSILLSALILSASAPITVWVHGSAERETYKLRTDHEQTVADNMKLGTENKQQKDKIEELESVLQRRDETIEELKADVSKLTPPVSPVLITDDAALPGKSPEEGQ